MKILIDSREKHPWNFSFYEIDSEICKLDEGDYTIEDYPNLVIIERKKDVGELVNNLGKKYEQFETEFFRMQKYKYRYLICEFSMELLQSFPKGSGIPKRMWGTIKMKPKFIEKRFTNLCINYDIQPIFCTNSVEAESIAIKLINEAIRNQ